MTSPIGWGSAFKLGGVTDSAKEWVCLKKNAQPSLRGLRTVGDVTVDCPKEVSKRGALRLRTVGDVTDCHGVGLRTGDVADCPQGSFFFDGKTKHSLGLRTVGDVTDCT